MTIYDRVRYSSLEGRVVLITGGASGIGAAMVEAFAAQDARVHFLDIDEQAAAALIGRLDGKRVNFQRCDVTDVTALRVAVATVEAQSGPIEALINNAARDDRHEMASVEPEYWDRNLAVNLNHQFFATQAVVRGMTERGGG